MIKHTWSNKSINKIVSSFIRNFSEKLMKINGLPHIVWFMQFMNSIKVFLIRLSRWWNCNLIIRRWIEIMEILFSFAMFLSHIKQLLQNVKKIAILSASLPLTQFCTFLIYCIVYTYKLRVRALLSLFGAEINSSADKTVLLVSIILINKTRIRLFKCFFFWFDFLTMLKSML